MPCSGELIDCEACQCRHPADFACDGDGISNKASEPNAHVIEPFRSILNSFAENLGKVNCSPIQNGRIP